jgi:Domain of unknown function (DUF4032)/ParB-like nuclease domain
MRRLKEFDEIQRVSGALAARPLGIIQVPIGEIVGSVGRARHFPKGLRPGRGLTPSRVRRLVSALNHGEVLPPVLLYRIGNDYFIADGHHRVAAAALAGAEFVDAEVVAYLSETHGPEDVLAWERVRFEQQTGITTIILHEVGQYPKLRRWIEDFRGLAGRGSLKTAARQWYARVYLPTVQDPVFRRLAKSFPGRSAGDIFVYLGDHKWIISTAAGHDVGVTEALLSFERRVLQHHTARGFVRWLEGLAARLPHRDGGPPSEPP